MKTITLLNEKGGVGKSTLSTHIAAGLALKGYRVVLVDTDPQANATSAVGLDKRPDFYDLTVRNADWRSVLRPVHPDVYSPPGSSSKGYLYAVSSNLESRNIANSISKNTTIRRRFAELRGSIDYIVVDTSPTPSLLHAAIALATDLVLIPTDCEAFSALEGLPDSILHVDDVRSAALEKNVSVAQIAGIIPNKYRTNTVSHNEVVDSLRAEYGELVWEPIKLTIAFSEAQLMRQFLYGVAPEHPATLQMWDIVNRLESMTVVA